jgi:hypothetical protein
MLVRMAVWAGSDAFEDALASARAGDQQAIAKVWR